MTLADVIPSLRSSLPPRGLDRELWPLTTEHGRGGISVGGVPLMEIEQEYGTPAYVLDEADVRERCAAYCAAFGPAQVVYAAKALLSRGLLRWIDEAGMGLAVYSTGQWQLALAAGFPAERVVVHGDVDARGAGRVVIESAADIARLTCTRRPQRQKVMLRLLPAQLGFAKAGLPACPSQDRFGVPTDGAELAELVEEITSNPLLDLVGLDVYLGSQLAQFGGYEHAITQLVAACADLRRSHGVHIEEINLGGGFAVAHTGQETTLPVDPFAARMRRVLALACDRASVQPPRLSVTPGRAIVARAGVALYRVLAVRHEQGHQLVAVDGGLSDNPRPALYGARYTAVLVGRPSTAATVPTTVVGRHDEAGDVLVRDEPLPDDLRPGDLIAVPGCGAYHFPLASNYDLVGRPPLIAVRDGQARVLVRRETLDDVLRRDEA
ncbi:diaminopimelate decarboxylase family protein [Catellatospora citrea]|uniref:Diaminopimelate decarboxylase n=1 Tax=Catellatospora citrea TaxID=53366 RepID=A0A8J3K6M6_9ACTN|nr:diaminopimelate decarboxylase [Catellatospora citrea]RKE05979.1 diaminopimelate decarboxylase [Catellatospora citrea]GIF97641.1 diaminopimelate decarboxylase [Catellatospora citrea]